MSELKLVASARTEFGKGAARRTRRAGLVPAVLYGHGADPVHVSLPGHATMLALKHVNALLTIELDGEQHLAIARDVQRDPVRGDIEHVDLLQVRRGEKIEVEVLVHVVGESAPGTIHVVDLQSVRLLAEATNLPEAVEVSIEGLEDGAQVRAGDIELPEGASLVDDPDLLVVSISVPRVSEEDLGESAAEEVAEEAAAESSGESES